ncbi:MAG TPA: STT3 domain-containing protein [Thermoanaerobaculia bacterium]|nr:STT3 domain-containing protein [Thermoanaerobaculia bacterium]
MAACYAAAVDDTTSRWRADVVPVALLFALALAVRLLPAPAATAGGLRLLSPDCYGHLRRAASVARNFPRVPVVDPYLNHPDGGVWIWPPAFDLAVGGMARARYGTAVTRDEVARVAAFLPPLLGALQLLPFFLLARRVFGRRRALYSAAAYALLPAAAIWSGYGHADQHVAEVFGLLLFLSAAARAVSLEGTARAKAALLSGAALALLVLTWQGAVLWAALGFLWGALFLGPAAALLAGAATLLVAAGTWATLGAAPVPFSYVSFGWFQPLFLAAVALPVVLAAVLRARGAARRAAALVLALGLLAAVAPNAGRIAGAVRRGGAYLAVRDTSTRPAGGDEFEGGGYLAYAPDAVRVIAESHPLFDGPPGPALARAVSELSAGLLVLPPAVVLWLAPLGRWHGPVARRRLAGRLLVVLFAATCLVLTLVQRRNVYYLALFTALALGQLLGAAFVHASRRLRRRRPGVSARLAAGSLAFVLLVLLGPLPGLGALERFRAYASAPGPDLLDLLGRLRTLDPPGADPAALPPPAPGAIPGVMAPWSMGHFVTALAERPAAADPFLYGFRRQARLFSSVDDAEALAILRASRVRYLITTDLRPVLARYAEAAGRPPAPPDATFAVRVHESADERPVPFLFRVLDSRTAARSPDGRIVPRFRVFRVDGSP